MTLRKCVRTSLGCADVWDTTARVLSRHIEFVADITKAVLGADATVCSSCADECGRHADHHEHCRVCEQACRRCERACRELIGGLGRGAGG
ncbi:hypothetical protein SAXI111661_02950 [Saccharomonospora xinjiangensis]|uniref:hypothetical protein n=1 Tax=Saccharomonospora xinjiangensis TaxID=75294 RepID=UPI0010C51DF5|nr:hypothetical protein EYD13_07570 [Saccharomonospora xinjiangensis]